MIIRSPIRDVLLDSVNNPIGFLPSDLAGLKLWTRYNRGIIVTGSGVSQWTDQSGNDNHLLQGTDTNRPSKESDGSILFDGVDNFLKAAAFTLVQPETIYVLGKQVTWTSTARWFDGNLADTGTLDQVIITPDLNIYAGAFLTNRVTVPLDAYGVITTIFNSTSSLLQLNNGTPSTAGSSGSSNMGGFHLGSRGGGVPASFGNIQVKEVLIFNTAHDAITRAKMIAYLAQVGGLSI